MTKHIVDFKRGCELAALDLDEPVTATLQTADDPQPAKTKGQGPT